MAFIVEDGTGVKGANSYGTLQGFKDYFTGRPDEAAAIALTDSVIQSLLVAASDYIDTRWGRRFLGSRAFQALLSRSVLTLTDNPTDGETVTFGAETYTFRASPTLDNDVEIGASTRGTLDNLIETIATVDVVDFAGATYADPDVNALTLFAATDGVTTTDGLANGSFDNATTSGLSRKRQPMEFPREDLTDWDGEDVVGVPDQLKEATYEYAFRANSGDLAPDPTVHASGQSLVRDRTKVGPIETEVEFTGSTTIRITKPFPSADRLLQEYVRSGGVIRA